MTYLRPSLHRALACCAHCASRSRRSRLRSRSHRTPHRHRHQRRHRPRVSRARGSRWRAPPARRSPMRAISASTICRRQRHAHRRLHRARSGERAGHAFGRRHDAPRHRALRASTKMDQFVVAGEREGNACCHAPAPLRWREEHRLHRCVRQPRAKPPPTSSCVCRASRAIPLMARSGYVRIRGLNQNLTTITMDGNRLADAASAGSTREYQFQTVSADRRAPRGREVAHARHGRRFDRRRGEHGFEDGLRHQRAASSASPPASATARVTSACMRPTITLSPAQRRSPTSPPSDRFGHRKLFTPPGHRHADRLLASPTAHGLRPTPTPSATSTSASRRVGRRRALD